MTNSNKKSKLQLKEDELATRLAPDGVRRSDAVLLTGYLGKGSSSSCWRLYKAPDLREFIEFDESEVVHCEKTKSDLFASQASLVWLKPTAELVHQRANSSAIAAEFLTGRIVEGWRGKSTFDRYLIADIATWTVTATAGGIPTPTPGSGFVCTEPPLCVLVPETIGMCGSKCNVCGVSVPQ